VQDGLVIAIKDQLDVVPGFEMVGFRDEVQRRLTEREYEIFLWLLGRKTYGNITRRFQCSEHTVSRVKKVVREAWRAYGPQAV